jgi:hypothetical protein
LANDVNLMMMSYQVMVRVSEDSDQALGYIDQARKLSDQHKQSTAPWDLEELALRIARQEAVEVTKLVQHISTSHIREPGIGDALFKMLVNAGLVSPDGRMMMPSAPLASNVISTDDPTNLLSSGHLMATAAEKRSPNSGYPNNPHGGWVPKRAIIPQFVLFMVDTRGNELLDRARFGQPNWPRFAPRRSFWL